MDIEGVDAIEMSSEEMKLKERYQKAMHHSVLGNKVVEVLMYAGLIATGFYFQFGQPEKPSVATRINRVQQTLDEMDSLLEDPTFSYVPDSLSDITSRAFHVGPLDERRMVYDQLKNEKLLLEQDPTFLQYQDNTHAHNAFCGYSTLGIVGSGFGTLVGIMGYAGLAHLKYKRAIRDLV